MNRTQLEHIIRAAGSVADDNEIIVLGSSSIFAQFPDLPDEFLSSVEADIFPKNKPYLSDLIDGCIGEISPFHNSFGYYAHGVSQETANNLPVGWNTRLIPIKNENTGGVTGWCLEIHDLIAGKYVSAREKDLLFISMAIEKRIVNESILLERIETLGVDVPRKEEIRCAVVEDFRRAPE
jgi:hypothetical protein